MTAPAPATTRTPVVSVPSVALLGALLLALALAPLWGLGSGYQLDVARRALYAACLTGIWSLLAGVAGQFSFGHVAIAGIAGYAGAVWARQVSAQEPVLGTIWMAIVVGVIAAWILGTALGLVVLRLRGSYLALFTLAFGEIARLVVIAEKDVTGGAALAGDRPAPGHQP